LEAQQHKKYAQTTPLGDGVSSLFRLNPITQNPGHLQSYFFEGFWRVFLGFYEGFLQFLQNFL
jgi:hypothetical protein